MGFYQRSSSSPTTTGEVKQRLREDLKHVNNNLLHDEGRFFEEGIQACQNNDGGHVEHFYSLIKIFFFC